jgi:hypothetical protein
MGTDTILAESGEKRRQIQTGLKLDADLYEFLKAESVRERLPISRVIARLIWRELQKRQEAA